MPLLRRTIRKVLRRRLGLGEAQVESHLNGSITVQAPYGRRHVLHDGSSWRTYSPDDLATLVTDVSMSEGHMLTVVGRGVRGENLWVVVTNRDLVIEAIDRQGDWTMERVLDRVLEAQAAVERAGVGAEPVEGVVNGFEVVDDVTVELPVMGLEALEASEV